MIIELLRELELWHLMCLAIVGIFICWCILINRPIVTDADLAEEEAENKSAAELKRVQDEYQAYAANDSIDDECEAQRLSKIDN